MGTGRGALARAPKKKGWNKKMRYSGRIKREIQPWLRAAVGFPNFLY